MGADVLIIICLTFGLTRETKKQVIWQKLWLLAKKVISLHPNSCYAGIMRIAEEILDFGFMQRQPFRRRDLMQALGINLLASSLMKER